MNFTDKVFEVTRTTSIKNLLAAAFMVDKGFNMVTTDNVPQFSSAFIGWIIDRKKDYMKAHPNMVHNEIIINRVHYIDFIVSGDWRK
ncbi:hypothetical protein ACU7KR_002233 [Escherichia coli]